MEPSDAARPTGVVAGLRASAPVALPTAAIGLTFGVLAEPVLGPLATVLMSALVWSGTAQFASVAVLAGGGSVALSATTGLLANVRFLPMGFAVAPSLPGGPLRRVATAAAMADASFAIAHSSGGSFDARAIVGAFPLQWGGWVAGTAAGVLASSVAADPERLGLDVLFGVFYLALLLPEVRRASRGVQVVALSAVITVVLVPFTPAGVPVLAASAAALLGLLPDRRSS